MVKAPIRGTIQPKERVQSKMGPPTVFPIWAVNPDHLPLPHVIFLQHVTIMHRS